MPDLKVVTPAPSTRLETLVEDYLARCRAKGLSPRRSVTTMGMRRQGVFLPWAAQEAITEPAQITTRVLDRFSSHLLEHGGKRVDLPRIRTEGSPPPHCSTLHLHRRQPAGAVLGVRSPDLGGPAVNSEVGQ